MKTTRVVKVCDRCPIGREQPVAATRTLALDGDVYRLDVCADHDAQLSREVGMWGRLGERLEGHRIRGPVADPPPPRAAPGQGARRPTSAPERPVVAVPSFRQAMERLRQAEQEAARAARKPSPVLAPDPAPVETLSAEEVAQLSGLDPAEASRWYITPHAASRMQLRHVSFAEAMWAAMHPDMTMPGTEPDTEVHIRAGVKAVVNPRTHVIITVARQDAAERAATSAPRKPLQRDPFDWSSLECETITVEEFKGTRR